MNQMKKMSISLVFFITSMLLVNAQSGGMNLSLDSAKIVAIRYNKTLAKQGLSIADANQTLWQTIAQGLPQAKATYNYQDAMGAEITLDMGIPGMEPSTIPIDPTNNLQLQVTQLLFSGNYWVGLKVSKIAKEMSVLAYKKTELDITKQVADSYYAILVAEETRSILQESLINLEQLLKNTETMVMVGVVESTSADQLSVQVASMKNSLSKVNQQIELAYNMLRLQLGLGAEDPLSLTEKLTNLVDEEAIAYLMLEPFNIHQNINIQLINKNLDLSKKQVAMAKTNFLPTVAGFYSYTHKLTTTSFDMTPNNMIGINASMPLFTSFSNCSKVKQAKIRYRSASIDKENLLDQLSIQEKQLRFNLKSANESYKIQKKNIEVSNRVFKNISTKYEQGAASALDIVNAHNNLLTAQSNYISSVMELLNAQSALNNLLGKK